LVFTGVRGTSLITEDGVGAGVGAGVGFGGFGEFTGFGVFSDFGGFVICLVSVVLDSTVSVLLL